MCQKEKYSTKPTPTYSPQLTTSTFDLAVEYYMALVWGEDAGAVNFNRSGHLVDPIRISGSVQWSAVRETAVTVTVGYSDSFGNPRFIKYYKSDTIRVRQLVIGRM